MTKNVTIMEDKVTKFGNCAHNLVPNVEALFVRMEMESESQLNFLADYIGCNLGSLENLVTAKEVDGEDVAQQNLDKLASRKERNVIDGSGDNR